MFIKNFGSGSRTQIISAPPDPAPQHCFIAHFQRGNGGISIKYSTYTVLVSKLYVQLIGSTPDCSSRYLILNLSRYTLLLIIYSGLIVLSVFALQNFFQLCQLFKDLQNNKRFSASAFKRIYYRLLLSALHFKLVMPICGKTPQSPD